MKRMSCLESPLKVLQSASDLDQILLRRGRTDQALWRPILLKLNFCHGLVDHSSLHVPANQDNSLAFNTPSQDLFFPYCHLSCHCSQSWFYSDLDPHPAF